MTSSHETTPSTLTKCIVLACHDHMAGILLHSVWYWYKYARAEIPQSEGKWCANTRIWWARETGMSLRQFDRAIAKLSKLGLIEKKQYWFGKLNILHVRTVLGVQNYIEAATTWDAVHDFQKSFPYRSAKGLLKLSDIGKPVSPKLANSMEYDLNGNPSSPISVNSNTMINTHNSFGSNKQQDALWCVNNIEKKEESIEGKKFKTENEPANEDFKFEITKKLQINYAEDEPTQNVTLTPSTLVNFWKQTVAQFHSSAKDDHNFPSKLTAKEIGQLLRYLSSIPMIDGRETPYHVMNYVIQKWSKFSGGSVMSSFLQPQSNQYPNIALFESADGYKFWLHGGRPKVATETLLLVEPVFSVDDVEPGLPVAKLKLADAHSTKYNAKYNSKKDFPLPFEQKIFKCKTLD